MFFMQNRDSYCVLRDAYRVNLRGIDMNSENGGRWRLNKQVNVSVIVQVVVLATLIVTSWVNLQRQLDMLQKDVNLLLDCQKKFEQRIEYLSEKAIAFEYRIRAIEKLTSQNENLEKSEK